MGMTKYTKAKKLAKELDIPKNEAQDLLRKSGWDMDEARLAYELQLHGADIQKMLDLIDAALDAIRKIDWNSIFGKIAESVKTLMKNMEEIKQKEVENGTERIPFEVYQGESENDLHSVP